MKTAVVLIGLLVAFVTAEEKKEWSCPLTAAVAQSIGECEQSMKPSAYHMALVWKGRSDGSRDLQCLYACVMKKAGLTNGAKINVEKMESLMRSADHPLEKNILIVVDLFKACKADVEVSEDECEVMDNFYTCWRVKWEAAFLP